MQEKTNRPWSRFKSSLFFHGDEMMICEPQIYQTEGSNVRQLTSEGVREIFMRNQARRGSYVDGDD